MLIDSTLLINLFILSNLLLYFSRLDSIAKYFWWVHIRASTMVDIGSFGTALGSLKTAYNIVAEFAKLKLNAETQLKLVELQQLIIAAQNDALSSQESQASLKRKIQELENKISTYDTWKQEEQRYELVDFGGGTFAYSLIESKAEGEPAHIICPSCFQNQQKSILQHAGVNSFTQKVYVCNGCKTTFLLGSRVQPAMRQASTQLSWLNKRR